MENGRQITYHEYKRRLKTLTAEIKKEKKKVNKKNQKNDNLLRLEEELNKLNSMCNNNDIDINNNNNDNDKNNGNDKDETDLNINENVNSLIENNLYSYNKVSKKSLKNIKKMKQRELEESRNEELKNKTGEKEFELLLEKLKINKTIFHINPDGNCLYESILHQLRERCKTYKFTMADFLNLINKTEFSLSNVNLKDYENKNSFHFSIFPSINPYDLNSDVLRFITAVFLLQNKSMFKNFIYFNESISIGNSEDDQYMKYCQEIINGVYGSEIEIKALSNILQKKITVYDVNMSVSYEENCDVELHISFHHKLYALGKHYNSVVDIQS